MTTRFQFLSTFCYVLRAIIMSIGLFHTSMMFADEEIERENKIKIAYLFHFSQFTEWAVKSTGFTYCVYDDTHFSKLLKEAYSEKILNGGEVRVLSVNADSNFNDCQLMFFPDVAPPEILTRIRKKPILTVGVQKDFIAQNGIVYMYEKDQKIRFFINNNNALEAGLKISSQLLALSKDATQ